MRGSGPDATTHRLCVKNGVRHQGLTTGRRLGVGGAREAVERTLFTTEEASPGHMSLV